MPKAVKNIVDISEGINSDASAKIISDQSVADAVNVNIDRSGKIRPAVGFVKTGDINITNLESGLYSFRTDDNSNTPAEYLLAQNGGTINRYNASTLTLINSFAAPNPAGMAYSNGSLLIYPKSSGNAKVFKSGDYVNSLNINYDTLKVATGLWLNGTFHSGDSDPDLSFLIRNDSEISSDNSSPAIAELDFLGKVFDGGVTNLDYKGETYNLGNLSAAQTDQEYIQIIRNAIDDSSAPISTSINMNTKVLTLTSEIEGMNGNGFLSIYQGVGPTFLFTANLTGGLDDVFDDAGNIDKVIPSGKYSFAASYVLWDGSETNIEGTSCSAVFEDRERLTVQVRIDNTGVFNNFIKGIKFYLESESFDYSLLGEYRHDNTKRFKFYNENDFSLNNALSTVIDLTLPLYSTFRFESGYDVGEKASPKMKKFIIVNNRGYAFNVEYDGEWNQDRIIVSPQGRPFLLPERNKIDIVTEDGDEYITAEHFGSFLYCFKKLTLFILNIGSNDPSSFYLADSIFGAGIDNEAAVCKTEVGVFWANKNGIYYHNGEELRNITFNRIEDEWKAINSDVIRCGYDIINKKVVIVRGNTTYTFDVRVGSFSKFNTIGSGNKSNFTVRDKKLSLIVDNELKEFSTAQGSTTWSITTRDFDLGRRAVRKKVRRFYVTFEDDAVNLSNFTFQYALDNTGNFASVSGSFINNDNTDKNTIAMFDLPRSITAYSVQLKITSTLQTSIKDISIVYRDKLPK